MTTQEHTVTDEAYLHMIRKLRVTGRKVTNNRDLDLKELDLTSNQADALVFFEKNPRSQITDLRDCLNISHQAACGLVDRMKTKGYLDVSVSEEDARAKEISLSASGMEKCAVLNAMGSVAGHCALKGFSKEEIQELSRMLDAVLENLRAESKERGN